MTPPLSRPRHKPRHGRGANRFRAAGSASLRVVQAVRSSMRAPALPAACRRCHAVPRLHEEERVQVEACQCVIAAFPFHARADPRAN
eukprot:756983-Hanusia_phi.AAC.4